MVYSKNISDLDKINLDVNTWLMIYKRTGAFAIAAINITDTVPAKWIRFWQPALITLYIFKLFSRL